MKHLIALIIVVPVIAALFYWYGHLWFPRLDIAYWSQAFPVAIVTMVTLALCDNSPAAKLAGQVFGFLFIVSVIVQTLVWVSIIQHPNF